MTIPKDLVEEILCCVPATYFNRLRSPCKQWNHLFKDDRRFARKHYDKAAKQCLVLMLKDYMICPMRVSLHGIDPSVEVKSKLSLVEPQSKYSAQFDISQVWNPLTGETRWIEAAYRSAKPRTFVLGYSQDKRSCIKSYKIWSFNRWMKDSEIYEFNSESWRTVDDDIVPGWDLGYSDAHCVSLHGKTYLFATDETIGLSLLRFDFSTEKSTPVPLPYQWHGYRATSLSVVREEKLSVLLFKRENNSKTDKIDETKVVSWSKVLTLDLSPDVQISRFASFLLDEEKKVVLSCERQRDEKRSKDTVYPLLGRIIKSYQLILEIQLLDVGQLFLITFQVWFKSSELEATKEKEDVLNSRFDYIH